MLRVHVKSNSAVVEDNYKDCRYGEARVIVCCKKERLVLVRRNRVEVTRCVDVEVKGMRLFGA